MALLHSHPTECMSSDLDIFSLRANQTSIDSSSFLHDSSVSSLNDDGEVPLELVVPSASEHCIELAHTMLYVQVKFMPASSTEEENIKAAPISNFLQSMFNRIDVFSNKKIVSSPSPHYLYRAYIETLLNYGPAARVTHSTSSLLYTDTEGLFEQRQISTIIERIKDLRATSIFRSVEKLCT